MPSPLAFMSSYLKDLVYSPRPYDPPVMRLTVGNHHPEYSLPPTHSTNSTSMALFLGAHVYDHHRLGCLSTIAFATWVVVLFIYVFSIVVGRLYTGMYGFMDCSVGTILKVISWLLQHLVMHEVEKSVQSSDWSVYLLLVNQHPSPVDDCPSFEDTITFASVILGIITNFWCSKCVPAPNTDLFTSVMPSAVLDSPAAITTWRATLLPPLFHWLAWASSVRLPQRRHYTSATEYMHGPPHTLRAVPGMIDLNLAVAEVVDRDAGVASGRRGRSFGAVER
ncbi:hypothetical protein EDB83DRAFT_2677080 [Lactarius deliciosus]|nr:hypothetical protein EDB83DRAFT_2677080 [Lactarius deliciosus]